MPASAELSWFTRSLSGWWCALGWCLATGAFIGLVVLFGGIFAGDSFESTYATWAVSHGHVACMYPPHGKAITTYAAPLYPLLSAGVVAVTQIGHGTAFPSAAALGDHCQTAVHAMTKWSLMAGVKDATLRLGFLSWLYLLVGLIWFLRASGRGRCGWEPTTAILVACLPPVWWSIEFFFHPQDLVAMGFALAAMACALRSQWVAAGILVALAVLTQQFALLVALPLLIVAPAGARVRFVGAASVTGLLVVGPLLALTSGSAARFIFLGSGDAVGRGGTLLWELQLNGAPLVVFSRIVPLALSLVLAWFVAKRLGPMALQPAALIAPGGGVAQSPARLRGEHVRVLLHGPRRVPRPARCSAGPHPRLADRVVGHGHDCVQRRRLGVHHVVAPMVGRGCEPLVPGRRDDGCAPARRSPGGAAPDRMGSPHVGRTGSRRPDPVAGHEQSPAPPARHLALAGNTRRASASCLAGGPLRDLLRQHAEQRPLETAERTPSLQH